MDVNIPPDVVNGLIVLGGSLITWGGWKIKTAITSLQKGVDATRVQVQNDHGTNLRDDMDKIQAAVNDAAAATATLQGTVRGLVDRLDAAKSDREILHSTIVDVKDDVSDLKAMYREALDQHREYDLAHEDHAKRLSALEGR